MNKIPMAARLLGFAGLIPFLGLAFLVEATGAEYKAEILIALRAYGAVILSFLGGIYWGLAIGRPWTQVNIIWLCVSVVPSLLAWTALLLSAVMGMGLLGLSIAAMVMVDLRSAKAGQAPPWYPALRLPLSVGASVSLFYAALGRLLDEMAPGGG
jgi:hypothetical protein